MLNMTQLVTDATHNGCSYRSNPQCNSNYTTHGIPSGDHMAIKFCVNARKPIRVRKEIVFRRLRHIRLPDFKRDITFY